MDLIVRSRRTRLAVRAAVIAVVGVGLGWMVETASFVERSALGHLSAATGLRAAFLVIAGFGAVMAYLSLRDDWHHRINFEADGIAVEDALGSFRVDYDNVAALTAIPLGGVGIALRDRERWARSVTGTDEAVDKRMRISAVTTQAYRSEVVFFERQLSIGSDAFRAEMERRVAATAPHLPPPDEG
jgi:hypothetical protein